MKLLFHCLLILLILFACFITDDHATTLDEQIAAALAEQKAASLLANQLASRQAAVRLDSIFQPDAILALRHVRVAGHAQDSMHVMIAVDQLSDLELRQVKVALGEAHWWFVIVGGDSIDIHRKWAEKALPVIAAALKGE